MWRLTIFARARASSHIVSGRLVLRGRLDGVGQEAEDSSDPQQDGEASKELSAKFDPFRGGGGWSESVGTIPSEILRSFSVGQTLGEQEESEQKSDRGNLIRDPVKFTSTLTLGGDSNLVSYSCVKCVELGMMLNYRNNNYYIYTPPFRYKLICCYVHVLCITY